MELAVVSSGERAAAWRRLLEDQLARTRNLSASPLRADGVVVVIDPSFANSMQRAVHQHDGCFQALRDALAAGKMLLPVTVGNAAIPEPDELPEGIRVLTRFQGLALDRKSDLPGVAARLVVATKTMSRPYVPERTEGRRVFLSYRRDDSWYWASLLARALTQRLGAGNVFFDVGGIAPGRRFDMEIRSRILGATDFVLLVGPAFLAPDPGGRRRLDDPADFVRQEIAAALEQHKPIHLVLAGGAALPDREGLPSEIAPAFEGPEPQQLTDYRAADAVAGAILSRAPPPGAPISPPPLLTPPLTAQEKCERFMMAAVPPLAALGWRPVDRALSRGAVVMTRGDEDPYRFVFDFEDFELILQERARSVSGLGLKRWIKRAVFSVSPDAPDIDVLRLPDRQVEAMENPGAYLDRTGRFDLDAVPPPPMPSAQIHHLLRASSQPAQRALDEHAREHVRIRARGGLRVLGRLRSITLGEGVIARDVAADPTTGRFAAASSGGPYLFGSGGGKVERVGPGSNVERLAFSRRGLLATTDDKHRLSVLDSEGREIVKRRSPYSAWKRATGTHGSFRTLSWSSDGSRIALGASDRIWIYHLEDDGFDDVALHRDGQGIASASALFAPGSDDLWIMHLWEVWRVSRSTGEVHGSLDIAAGSEFHDAKSGTLGTLARPSVGLNPTCLAVSPDGKRLAVGGNDAQLLLVDAETVKPTGMRVWHAPIVDSRFNGEITALAFSPDGRRLASVAHDSRLVVGDVRSGDSVADGVLSREAPSDGAPLRPQLCWSGDGRRIAVTNREGRIEIWDATSPA